jgi:hypothetical protein
VDVRGHFLKVDRFVRDSCPMSPTEVRAPILLIGQSGLLGDEWGPALARANTWQLRELKVPRRPGDALRSAYWSALWSACLRRNRRSVPSHRCRICPRRTRRTPDRRVLGAGDADRWRVIMRGHAARHRRGRSVCGGLLKREFRGNLALLAGRGAGRRASGRRAEGAFTVREHDILFDPGESPA